MKPAIFLQLTLLTLRLICLDAESSVNQTLLYTESSLASIRANQPDKKFFIFRYVGHGMNRRVTHLFAQILGYTLTRNYELEFKENNTLNKLPYHRSLAKEQIYTDVLNKLGVENPQATPDLF